MSAPTARELLDTISAPGDEPWDALSSRVEAALAILAHYRAPATSGCADAALLAEEIQRALDGRQQ